MKTFIKITSLLLISAFMLGAFAACSPNDDPPIEAPDDKITVKLDSATLVYDSSSDYKFISKLAGAMGTYLSNKTGKSISAAEDVNTNDFEILIGKCNRSEFKSSPDELLFRDFFLYFENNKLSVDAVSIYGYEHALSYLLKVFENGIEIPRDGLRVSYDYGEGDYGALRKNYENQNLERAWMVNISHRGDVTTNNNPENSIPAYQSCIDNKIDVIETDLQKTKDGVWVICHDPSTNRTANGNGRISELTLKEVKNFYLKEKNGGTGTKITKHRIPTLEEVIELCRGKILLNLDKLTPEMYREIYEIFEENDAAEIAMFKGASADFIIDWFCELVSEGRKLPLFSPMSYSGTLSSRFIDYKGLTSMVEAGRQYTKEEIEAAREIDKNIRVMCLTALEPQFENATNWNLLKTRGFTAIMTDSPIQLKEFIHGEE